MNNQPQLGPFRRSSNRTTRLSKYLADAGIVARRKADALVAEGRVSINGVKVRDVPAFVDPTTDTVTVDGNPISSSTHRVLYALYKPRGIVSTLADDQGKPCLSLYIASITERVFPVGRLDEDSEGLLLLTNDGQLALQLTHPRYHHTKRYRVWIEGSRSRTNSQARQALARSSVGSGTRRHRFDTVELVGRESNNLIVDVTVHSGITHLVRRLMDKAGYTVVRLVRTQHGPYRLGSLLPGQIKLMEIQSLPRS